MQSEQSTLIDTNAKPIERNSEKQNSQEASPMEERYIESYCQIVGQRPAVHIEELPNEEGYEDLIV